MNYDKLAQEAKKYIEERMKDGIQNLEIETKKHAPYHVVDQLPLDDDLITEGTTFRDVSKRRGEHADKIREVLNNME